jgi:hypothetical protein
VRSIRINWYLDAGRHRHGPGRPTDSEPYIYPYDGEEQQLRDGHDPGDRFLRGGGSANDGQGSRKRRVRDVWIFRRVERGGCVIPFTGPKRINFSLARCDSCANSTPTVFQQFFPEYIVRVLEVLFFPCDFIH